LTGRKLIAALLLLPDMTALQGDGGGGSMTANIQGSVSI